MKSLDPQMQILFFAGLVGALGIAVGAFGAHGLEGQANESEISAIRTGGNYALIHAAALLGIGGYLDRSPRLLGISAWFIIVGVIVFLGSLIFYGYTGFSDHLWITPISGGLMILGWFLITIAASMNLHKT